MIPRIGQHLKFNGHEVPCERLRNRTMYGDEMKRKIPNGRGARFKELESGRTFEMPIEVFEEACRKGQVTLLKKEG